MTGIPSTSPAKHPANRSYRLLPVARKAGFNYACAIGMAIAPAVALVSLRDDPSSAPFVLTAIGLAIVIVGVYIVSNVWKEPLYDVMLAWDPEAMPTGWSAGRRRYFAINWIPNRGNMDGVRVVSRGADRNLGVSLTRRDGLAMKATP
jgi:hypothetical protein